MDDITKIIERISGKEDFLSFIQRLVVDYRENPQKWENKSVDEYLQAMISWIEDFSSSEFNDIDWNKIDYITLAKLLYMGKIYE